MTVRIVFAILKNGETHFDYEIEKGIFNGDEEEAPESVREEYSGSLDLDGYEITAGISYSF